MSRRLAAVLSGILLTVTLVAGCAGTPVLANAPVSRPVPAAATPTPPRPPDPQPIVFPADDGAHDRLTEWWYVTGHLVGPGGRRFGFEDVVFRAERGAFPVTWAGHLALTDEDGHRFLYAQRSEIGPQVATAAPGADFAFSLTGSDPAQSSPWTMTRQGGVDRLTASAAAGEVALGGAPGAPSGPAFGIHLALRDSPPVLHGTNGWIDFGPAGGSYYYSRTRQPASGTVNLDGAAYRVTGIAWFDHQWGDFISVGGGGWDWFAVNLDDQTDLTLSLVRAADGSYPLVYGTLIQRDGRVEHLPASAFTVTASKTWTSPRTGAAYPAAWQISLPADGLDIELAPTVPAQELDTRATTGVTYWEGSQRLRASRHGAPLGGEAYVELTGYGPSG